MTDPDRSGLRRILEPLVEGWRRERAELLADGGEVELARVAVRDLHRGLRGVPAVLCDTSVVDPDQGLLVRGAPVVELLDLSAEALFFLLLTGRRPSAVEEGALRQELDRRARVPPPTLALVDELGGRLHPMTVLSMATLSLQAGSSFGRAHAARVPREELWAHSLEDALRLVATLPVVAARLYRAGLRGLPPIDRPPGVGLSEAFAAMLGLGEGSEDFVRFLGRFTVVHADHEGANASVLSARVTHSTMSDLYYALSSAMNCLAGPLHGRSNQESVQMLLEIEERYGPSPTREQLQGHVRAMLDAGRVVPGFGHAVLRGRDPRYDALLSLGRRTCRRCGPFAIAEALEGVVSDELRARGKAASPHPNIDGISGALLHDFGMTEVEFYTVMFSVAQSLGLTAQLVIERALGAPLFRPRSMTTEGLRSALRSSRGRDEAGPPT